MNILALSSRFNLSQTPDTASYSCNPNSLEDPRCAASAGNYRHTLPSPPMSSPPSPSQHLPQRPGEETATAFRRADSHLAEAQIARQSRSAADEPATLEAALNPWERRQREPPSRMLIGQPPGSHSLSPGRGLLISEPVQLGRPMSRFSEVASSSAAQAAGIEAQSGPVRDPALSLGIEALRRDIRERSIRPSRRSKTHVASACVNCKRAHLSCDDQRPCARCVASNKQDTCYDVPHKKRGRPRLRDEREARLEHTEGTAEFPHPTAILPAPNAPATAAMTRHRSVGNFQVLRSQHGDPAGTLRSPHEEFLPPGFHRRSAGEMFPAQVLGQQGEISAATPIAYLNLDLRILRTNPAFQSLFSGGSDSVGKNLADLLDASYDGALQRLRTDLRAERQHKDHTYLPPIISDAEQDAVHRVSESEIERVSEGFHDRVETYAFILSNGQAQVMPARIRLARTTHFFVTLVLPPLPQRATQPSFSMPRGPSPVIAPASSARNLSFLTIRQSPFSSAPTSPFSSLQTLGTSLPPGNIPLTSYGVTSQNFWQPQLAPAFTSPRATYTGLSRPQTAASESTVYSGPLQEPSRSDTRGHLQLPPIVSSASSPIMSTTSTSGAVSGPGQTDVRPSTAHGGGEEEDAGHKRRRLNIREMLG